MNLYYDIWKERLLASSNIQYLQLKIYRNETEE
jgi:hypothetical protein